MALYDYECEKHGLFELAHAVPAVRTARRCPKCHRPSRPLVSCGVKIGAFIEYEEWNLEPNAPVKVGSARQLDAEAAKRGFTIMGGGTRSRLAKRELEQYHHAVATRIKHNG